jgi:hypothetical protein
MKRMNKKGMIANIIGGFIVILVGVSLIPVITQEIDNMYNCGSTSYNSTEVINYEQPIGETDSFGGGGAGQFGGYNGKVHKSWASQYVVVKTNKSFLMGSCTNMTSQQMEVMRHIFDFIPLFFALVVLLIGIASAYNGLKQSGLG